MRQVIAATLLVLFGAADARAGDTEQSNMFHYDIESLTASLDLSLGRGRISFSIANALELPEYEPPGGVYLDEATLLTDELNGFEVDVGDERMFSLLFSFDW